MTRKRIQTGPHTHVYRDEPDVPFPCVHRGAQRQLVGCEAGCVGTKLFTFDCALHGLCTIAKKGAGVQAVCATCEQRDEGGTAILLTGGIGDVLTLEGMMTPSQRNRLETIYYACPAVAEIKQLFAALPNYPRLKNHVVLSTGSETHYSKATVEEKCGLVRADDWSIATIFPQRLAYHGSSFLVHRVAEPPKIDGAYAVIVHDSTWGRFKGRAFTPDDWAACISHLEALNLRGLVLTRDKRPVHEHQRLQVEAFPILTAIETVKGAAAYIGIDSWATVLASKLFTGDRLLIKSVSPHLHQWKQHYYAPQTDFSFIRERIEPPA